MKRSLSKITNIICQILTDYLASEGYEYEVNLGNEFAYYYCEESIDIALLVHDEMGKWFMEYARTIGLKYDCGTFLLSFFHEVGHGETFEDIPTIDFYYSEDIKPTLKQTKEDCITYFSLPDERMATEWAINYLNNNREKVRALAEDLIPLFEEIRNKYHLMLA